MLSRKNQTPSLPMFIAAALLNVVPHDKCLLLLICAPPRLGVAPRLGRTIEASRFWMPRKGKMGGRLKGRAALVTGGGRGIGLAIALELVRENGVKVAVSSRNERELSPQTLGAPSASSGG